MRRTFPSRRRTPVSAGVFALFALFALAAPFSFGQDAPSPAESSKSSAPVESSAPVDLDALTRLPRDASKDELVAFQAALTQAGDSVEPAEYDAFLAKAGPAFYESTKAILACDLTDDERARYSSQFAQILATLALQEGVEAQKLGPKYDELAAFVDASRPERPADGSALDPADPAQIEYVARANYAFLVRLRFAQNLPAKTRDEAFAALAGDAISFALANPEYGETAFQIVMSIKAFSSALGAEALDALCEAFDASKNPKLTQPIRLLLGRRRFARLPGNELKFEGLLLKDGEFAEPFDWAKYEGKVVLVEFWATWCGPCRKEIPRLKEKYAQYRDAGFEIVGYSIDRDVAALKRFLVENEIDWPIVSQEASVAAGFERLYDYYSINGVPELILIGRDGKVLQTDARGPKLTKALKELFPDVEVPDPTEPEEESTERATEPGTDAPRL